MLMTLWSNIFTQGYYLYFFYFFFIFFMVVLGLGFAVFNRVFRLEFPVDGVYGLWCGAFFVFGVRVLYINIE